MYQEPKNNSTNPELKKYYSYLKQNGADVPPDYNSFERTLKDVNASKQYYDYLKKEGFDAPDNYDAFASTFGLKKKESSQSPSVQPKSGSVPKTGSSGTQEFEYKPVYDERKIYDKKGNLVKIDKREVYEKDSSGNLVPKKEKVLKGFASSTEEREIVREEQKQKAQKTTKPTIKYEQYKTAVSPKQEEVDVISQEVDNELNQQGFWNGIATGMKKGVNIMSNIVGGDDLINEQPYYKEAEQAKKELLSETKGDISKVTPEAIKQRTKYIVVQKRTEGLKIDKNNNFLSSLPKSEKEALNLEAVSQYKTLGDKDKYLATEAALRAGEIEKLNKDYAVTTAYLKKANEQGIQVPAQFIDKALELENTLKSKYNDFTKIEKEYIDNDKEIGSIEEEVDFLKRNYSTSEKLKNDAKLGLADIFVNAKTKLPLLLEDLGDLTTGSLNYNLGENSNIEYGLSDEERQINIDEAIDWENAKTQTKSKFKRDVEFDNLNINNFGGFLAQELGNQVGTFTQIMLPGGVVSMGITSSADKYGQMEMESNGISFNYNGKQLQGFEREDGSIVDETGFKYNPDEVEITSLRTPDYSKKQMVTAAIGFGTAEALLGALPTKSALGRVAKSFEQSGKRQLIRDGVKTLFVKPLNEAKQEAWTEGATSVVQNFIDIKVLGKNDVGLFDNVDHAMFTGGMLGGLMGSVPAIAGVAMRPFSSKTETKQVRKNLEMVLGLREQLNNQELTEATRKAISDKITALETENTQILTSVAEKSKGLSKEQYEAIVGIDKKQELLRLQATEIKSDNSISNELKKQLLNDLKVEFSSLEDKRNILVSDKATILDTLPDSEKTKFRNEATQILKTEYKGEGEPKIEDKAVTKKAIQLYNQSKSNEAKVTESTVEEKPVEQPTTQPQAEAQAEVGEVENVSLTNEVNIPESEAITTETLTENETTSQNNIESNGGFRPTIGEVAEVGGTTEQTTENATTESISPTANIGTSEAENEVEYVKKEIEKGILNWSGDIGSPRIDLGISWSDIRKGEADIKKGNVNTVPAKRLIEAINKAKKEGGYRYKQGTGGKNMKIQEFVTFEDIQRTTNEDSLTDAEINEIMANQNELATEYDEYFNSLDEQTQNEILENYENQPREIVEDTQRGESEINVSNEKETAAEPKQEVEKTVLDRILNQDELKDTFDFLDSFKIDTNDLKATLPFLPEVWNAFIEAVKLSMKAGNSIRNAMDIAFEKMKQEGSDANELTNVYNLFGKKFTENFVPKETKEFVEAITSDTNPENDSVEFEKMASNFPNTGEVGTYLSGETIEKYTGESPENNQEIFRIKLVDSLKHGIDTIQVAMDKFGDNFVQKVLEFAENNNIPIESKALLYVSLENELNRQKLAFPENKSEIQKKLNLVRAKRQAFARSNSLALNMNRLQKFAEVGFDVNEITDKMFSNKEKETRKKVENAIESTMDDINNEESSDEFDSDFVIAEPKNKRSKEDAKKDLNDALKALKEDWKKLNKGITLNATIPGYKQIEVATPHILKMAKAMAEIGGYNTKEIIETIYDNLKGTFNGVKKSDISNILKEDQTKSKPKKNQKMKDLVKQALINRGYFREVNKKKKDGTRELVKLLDWKKLAGEEGSIKNIKDKTEEALKDMGYTDSQIQAMQNALLEEYNDLRASIIEKSINELENRNRIKPVSNRKTISKKLAELYNYGLFEENMDAYENLLNSAIGFNEFQQKQFDSLKKYGKALSVLFGYENGKNKDQKFSEMAIKTQASIINHEIKNILSTAAFMEGNKMYKFVSVLRDYAGLSQRSKLLSLKQFFENPLSGFVERKYQQIGEFFDKKENGKLVANRKKLAKHIYNDIAMNGGLFYGEVTSTLVNQTKLEDWLNKQSDSKIYHLVLTNLTGRSYLEAADSMNKALITEKFFHQNLVKLLTSEGSPIGKMSKKEAVDFIAENLTGQNFEEAKVLAGQVIDKVNSDAGQQILPKTDANIFRFATDIVKESLNQGNKMDIDLIEKAYNAAYKSAGFTIGHEANNVISKGAGVWNARVEVALEKAIKEKKWSEATMLTLESILTKNIINPFVGGGTNWLFLTLQKAGMDPISLLSDFAKYRSNKIDLTTEEGIKNLENAMVRSTNFRNTATRNLIGAVVSISMAAAYIASGVGDDIEDWLKENEWARKYFKVVSPTIVTLMIANENEKLGKALQDLLNIKSDNFNETLSVMKAIDSEKKSLPGEIGRASMKYFDTPLPWRFIKDVDNVQRGLKGIPEYKSDYRVTGFLNGVYQGGLVDYIGLRPEGDFVPKSKDSEGFSLPQPPKPPQIPKPNY